MSQPANHWKLGLFVALGIVAAIALLLWVGAARLERDFVPAYLFFDEEVEGLEVGSPIKFRGVPIGRVVDIRFAVDQRHVEVHGKIFTGALERIGLETGLESPEDGPFMPAGLRVQVVTNLLTGVSFLQGDFFDPASLPPPEYPFLVPWNTVHTAPSTTKDISRAISEISDLLPPLLVESRRTLELMSGAIEDIDPGKLSRRIQGLAAGMEEVLRELELEPVLGDLRATLQRVNTTVEELGLMIGRLESDARLAETTAALRDAAGRVSASADDHQLTARPGPV
ncbi:MAG: MlaD family protein, partial [Planctomycetota bacterium]